VGIKYVFACNIGLLCWKVLGSVGKCSQMLKGPLYRRVFLMALGDKYRKSVVVKAIYTAN
jgi:hypothetical protein